MRYRFLGVALLAIFFICLASLLVYQWPPVHQRLAWRVDTLRAQIRYALNPPEQEVFVPEEQQALMEAMVNATLHALTPLALQGDQPATTATPSPTPLSMTPTPSPSPSPTVIPTSIPEKVALSGIVHEYQKFNNCGPANLSMALSYWGWQGDQFVTRAYLRPSYEIDDKNVNPFEMVDFVNKNTDLNALFRVGGDLETLKRFNAAGYPVIVEKGLQLPDEYWLGHFQIISGYDEPNSQFMVYDSYIGVDYGYPVPYQEIQTYWQNFNYVYVVIYPAERQDEVMRLLGPQADETYNYQYAAQKAREETTTMNGRDLFFAWFNLGTNLVYLQDYPAAAEAYDTAFAIYPDIPEKDRPWRTLWYQVGPYPAYYYTGRYQDVINLAGTTLTHVDKPVLEETYYWRGLAREALGNRDEAIVDLKRAANLNPHSTDALEQLHRLGVEIP